MNIRYTIVNDSVSIVHNGSVITIRRGQPNFNMVVNALVSGNYEQAVKSARTDEAIKQWAKGRFKVVDGFIEFDSVKINDELNNRIFAMIEEGKDPDPLFRFWERLSANPSHRSVSQLWNFLNLVGIPLTSDGCFLAYKGVRNDFFDQHSGKFENKPGSVISMPRNQISDDPNHACHAGLHVGSLEYASNFGPKVVICKVDPAHVVCIPNDHGYQKMRVEKYTVVGVHNDSGHMPSTVVDDDDFFDDNEQYYDGATSKAKVAHHRFDNATIARLEEELLDDLRKYATHLKIVGNSKLSKKDLIRAIAKARQ